MPLKDKDTFQILRASEGGYTDGYYVAGERTQLVAKGNIQPASFSNEEITTDPRLQGKDLSGAIAIYTNTELLTVDNSALSKADIVVFNNKMFEVFISSGPRSFRGETRYQFIAEYRQVLDDNNGDPPIQGDPFKAFPYPYWHTISEVPDGIITTFTFNIPFKKIDSVIIMNGPTPINQDDYEISEDGSQVNFLTESSIPQTDDIIKAYGV